jgi:hypothetical protein
MGGAYIQQFEAGGIETGTLATRSNMQVGNDLDVRGGLQVARGIETTGPLGVYGGFGSVFVVNQRGNVGIGTPSPEHMLHVDGAINLDPITEPSNPSTGFVIYCDSADGRLKAKSSLGAVTILANP